MHIQPYSKNPFYWEYNGASALLIGGTVEDNVFQINDLKDHLKLLASVGGNYVRCTMSSRDEGDVWAFLPDGDGIYDLIQPNPVYWEKFENLLSLAQEHNIIVQIEVWDRFDFARDPWQDNPFNPKNNRAYTVDESGLVERIDTHPGKRESAFFRSVPNLENNMVVLPYQHLFLDWLLEVSLKYPNVLYCIDNETNESPEWGKYWATYIQRKSDEVGHPVFMTEMWDAWDLNDPEHDATINHPEIYGFVDVSQNNHNVGLTHWENLQSVRQRIKASGELRPLNMVKIYGANSGRYGTNRDAQERFWRAVFGGVATARFHRPPAGLGLSEITQAHLQSMRMFVDEMQITACEPHLDLIIGRSVNEAYCIANSGVEYGVVFPDGGDIQLQLGADTPVQVRWLNILKSEWQPVVEVQQDGKTLRLKTPTSDGYWAVLVQHIV
jgi:hypothetical protein